MTLKRKGLYVYQSDPNQVAAHLRAPTNMREAHERFEDWIKRVVNLATEVINSVEDNDRDAAKRILFFAPRMLELWPHLNELQRDLMWNLWSLFEDVSIIENNRNWGPLLGTAIKARAAEKRGHDKIAKRNAPRDAKIVKCASELLEREKNAWGLSGKVKKRLRRINLSTKQIGRILKKAKIGHS
jgi:hypothetical protein